ncbi:helix-turn-helix domain-containing protein [Cellulomonas sp.]|uniref:helix-turn-helix domain-containing protein n=1 Tax=Cellulomonas sp. TaxID=40001 RepID=UPI00258E7096|nr:helix-turn-helix domain-containing protein [Cellulomonas sp.]MCR6689567.1 helix-turn-helix domain-containing protein [Cellulomonas sp.]
MGARDLGERVKDAREAKGLSRRSVAQQADVSYAFVQQLETGVRPDPGARKLKLIAGVLGVTVDELLGDAAESSVPAGTAAKVVHPAREEIDSLLDSLSPDKLIAVRDMVKLLAVTEASSTAPVTV